MKRIISLVVIIFIVFSIFFNMDILWKLAGASFVNEKSDGSFEIVYKGETIAFIPHGCTITFTKDLEEVESFCGDKKTVWKNGILQAEVLKSNE